MARHNFLVQRFVDGNNDGAKLNDVGNYNPTWRDCGTGPSSLPTDEFGNVGFQSQAEARELRDALVRNYPTSAYRIIQIIS